MTDRTPLILNTANKRIEQVQSSDTVYVPKDLSVYSDIRSAHIDDSNALNTGYYARTDFLTHGILGGFFTTSATNNGSISVASVNPSSHNGCINYLALNTLTNPTSNPCLIGNNLYLNSSFAEYEFCTRISLSYLSTVSEDYGFYFGLLEYDQTNISYTGNIIAFMYNKSYHGDNIMCTTNSGLNTNTNTNSNVTATTSWKKLLFKLDRNNNAPRVRFYIDNSLAVTHTSNIPDSTSNTHFKCCMFKQAGTGSRELMVDYAYFKITYLNRQTRF